MINERAKAILEFCFIKTPLEQWFKKDDEFDTILDQGLKSDKNTIILRYNTNKFTLANDIRNLKLD